MNTQIVHVPEKGTGHDAHTQQECPGDGLASQQSASDSSVLLSSRLLSWEYQPAWFSLYHSRLGKMTTWSELLWKAFCRPCPSHAGHSLSSWGNSSHCVVWLLILGIPSEFEAGGSLTTPVLSSELERMGYLQSSCRCCPGLVECPSFPLGSWP